MNVEVVEKVMRRTLEGLYRCGCEMTELECAYRNEQQETKANTYGKILERIKQIIVLIEDEL